MNIGNYEVTIGTSGLFRLDGGAMFGVVPKVLWERHHPSDEKNRISMCTNLLLITGEGKNILVDTGNSTEVSDKMKAIYGIDNTSRSLGRFLAEHGLTNTDITDVILTHLHFDHAGGGVQKDGNGNFVPAFPNAVYHVQKVQFDWAVNPSGKDRASYLKEHFIPLKEAGLLNLLEGPGTLFPGIELLTFEGHTPGQQLPLLEGNGTPLFFAGDLIPLSSHISPPWIMSYDLNPLQSLREKESVLPRAAEEGWTVVFEHDPVLSQAVLELKDGSYSIKADA